MKTPKLKTGVKGHSLNAVVSRKHPTCYFWQGDCGFKAVAEIRAKPGGQWKPICNQHLSALRRRKRIGVLDEKDVRPLSANAGTQRPGIAEATNATKADMPGSLE